MASIELEHDQDLTIRGWLAHLPATTMLLSVLVFAAAEAALRQFPFYTQGFVLSLLPLAFIHLCGKRERIGGYAAAWVWCLLAGGVYLALVQWLRSAPLVSWVALQERVVGIAFAVAALATAARATDLLSVLGASAAASITICTAVMWHRGDSGGWFGMSNINYLVNTAGPAVIAWSALLTHRLVTRRRPPIAHLMLAAVGAIALIGTCIAHGRRGVFLAALAAAGACVLMGLARRRPRLAWSLGIGGALAVLVAIATYVALYDQPPMPGRVRIPLWQAAWGLAMTGLPFGHGSLGAILSHDYLHPWTQRYGAGGAWDFHAHNEFLNVLIDGGPILLGLLLTQIVLVILQLRSIPDRSAQIALACLAAATGVHMFTSVCWATPVGYVLWHLYVAAIFKQPATAPRWRLPLPASRILILPLAALAGIGGAWTSRKALIHREASHAVKYASLLEATPPIGLIQTLKPITSEHLAAGSIDLGDRSVDSDEITARFIPIYGNSGPFLQLRFLNIAKRYGHAISEGDPQRIATLRVEFAQVCRQVTDHFPFDPRTYRRICIAIRVDPPFADALDPGLILRARYHNLEDELPEPDLGARPTDIDGLADLYARTMWAIVHEHPWPPISQALEHLVGQVGHVPEVSATAIQAAAHAGVHPTFAWTIELAPIMRRIARKRQVRNVLEDIETPWRARGALPLIRALYPDVFTRIEQGRNAISRRVDRIPTELQALRIYRISRIEAEPGDVLDDDGTVQTPPAAGVSRRPADRPATGSQPRTPPAAVPTPDPGPTPAPGP